MKIYIRNMVCSRCITTVQNELTRAGLTPDGVILGEAVIENDITPAQYVQLKSGLTACGLELIEDKKSQLIERIKAVIVDMIHFTNEQLPDKFSVFLSEKLGYNYTYLANIFSLAHGSSIEHFRISHRIERVKELLEHGDLTLSEIAWKLHYSSVAHLSSQFKKITGKTATHFKQLNLHTRISLDSV